MIRRMIRRIVEHADLEGLTGLKRVGFFMIAPFVYILARSIRLVKIAIKAFKDHTW